MPGISPLLLAAFTVGNIRLLPQRDMRLTRPSQQSHRVTLDLLHPGRVPIGTSGNVVFASHSAPETVNFFSLYHPSRDINLS